MTTSESYDDTSWRGTRGISRNLPPLFPEFEAQCDQAVDELLRRWGVPEEVIANRY
jgi:hypothetical protein